MMSVTQWIGVGLLVLTPAAIICALIAAWQMEHSRRHDGSR